MLLSCKDVLRDILKLAPEVCTSVCLDEPQQSMQSAFAL